jgi:putative phosphoesterase
MKYMIISDIHGSRGQTEKALKQFESIKADFLIILGDILYHGPRNPLPGGHDPKGVCDLLNKQSAKIIAVRGNCDAEVDQFLLNFPCMSDYTLVVDEAVRLFLTHGHIYSEHDMPAFNLPPGSFFFSGHSHIRGIHENAGITFCNPGSISLPKTDGVAKQVASFAVYEKGKVALYELE